MTNAQSHSAVVTDEDQARKCFNLTDSDVTAVPLPVELTSTITGSFICDDAKPFIQRFSCTHFGRAVVWHFNGSSVATFHSGDKRGRSIQKTYPRPPAKPVFNVTAVLVLDDNSTVSDYNVPFCVTYLTVQPYDVNNVSVIPFNVSCNTFCADDTVTEVCQVREYNIAGV